VAERAGRVVAVAVAVGDRVGEGQLLLRIVPEGQ
jgi:multidrug efflux pump subunit AcrA (membrane-fusion protein)